MIMRNYCKRKRNSKRAIAALVVLTKVSTTDAFVVLPPSKSCALSKTSLGYIQEGHNTGIGPDFLKKQTKGPTKADDFIDAVVVEEGYVVDDDEEEEPQQQKRHPVVDIFPNDSETTPSIWDTNTAKTIQGGALRTYSMEVPEIDHTQVLLKSHGSNPLHAQIDVWDGPDHAPMKLALYCAPRKHPSPEPPFSCVIPTPGYNKQSIGIKNSGPLEFPIESVVIADVEAVKEKQKRQAEDQPWHPQEKSVFLNEGIFTGHNKSPKVETPTSGLGLFAQKLRSLGDLRKIEGTSPVQQAKETNEEWFRFDKTVDSVQVLVETNGLSCQARIEVTADGWDEIQQVVELSIQDGQTRPFFAVLDTSGFPNRSTTVKVVNLDPYSAFPITACVEPYTIRADNDDDDDRLCNSEEETTSQTKDFSFIDATMIDEEEPEEYPVYAVPDVTIPANLADYDFDEEFFFAS